MDQHIKDLFEAAQPFDEGELYQSQAYALWSRIILNLEREMGNRFGQDAETLLMDYIYIYFEVERLTCLHYFYHGYLAGEAETREAKS